mgnify:CR=1 FL=1
MNKQPDEKSLTQNFAPRQQGIRFIILHCTEVLDDAAALRVYMDPEAELSCHYYISYQGSIVQLVEDENTAWHAGRSAWQNTTGLNHHSLGIEIGNPGENANVSFTEEQYKALEDLLTGLMQTHNIPRENILAHSDIATNRKRDPGNHFDWRRLEEKGLAAPFARPQGAQTALQAIYKWGYHGEEADVIKAFQRRYLPEHMSGHMCEKTKLFIMNAPRQKK